MKIALPRFSFPKRVPPYNPPGVLKQYIVDGAKLLSWGAFAVLVYVVWLRGLQFSRDTSFALSISRIGFWEIPEPINFWFPMAPIAFGLAIMLGLNAKYALPILMSLKGKGPEVMTAKVGMWLILIATVVSTLTASFPLVHESMGEKYRASAVAVESVEAGKAGKEAVLADMRKRLGEMRNGTSIEAQAAREGAAGWPAKVAIAKKQLDAGQLDQTRFDRIERAGSAADAADALQADINAQIALIASAPTKASVVDRVESNRDYGAQSFSDFWLAWWPAVSFFALEMSALFFMLIAVVLELTRDRQLEQHYADKKRERDQEQAAATQYARVTDQTSTPQEMPQMVNYDQDGNEMRFVRTGFDEVGNPKGYWRRKAMPKAAEPVTEPEAPATETPERRPSDSWATNEVDDERIDIEIDKQAGIGGDATTDFGKPSGGGLSGNDGTVEANTSAEAGIDGPNGEDAVFEDVLLDGTETFETPEEPIRDGNAITVWEEDPAPELEDAQPDDQAPAEDEVETELANGTQRHG